MWAGFEAYGDNHMVGGLKSILKKTISVQFLGLLTVIVLGSGVVIHFTGHLGYREEMRKWSLTLSSHAMGSVPVIQSVVEGLKQDEYVHGYAQLPTVCPFQQGVDVELTSIVVTKNRQDNTSSITVVGPLGSWVLANVGKSYGHDFFIVASDSLDCSPSNCAATLFYDTWQTCVMDSFGRRLDVFSN